MKYVWLDVDPGHDDAAAILLALHQPDLLLLGISTVHGNASADCTANNAARCLVAFGAPSDISVYPGAAKPLLRPTRHDPEIHGIDGLGGVEGLPDAKDPAVQARFTSSLDGSHVRALDGMSRAIRDAWCNGRGHKTSVVSCGPMTNIALFVSVYPDLLDAVEQFVFMGGGVGLGNRSAVAEFNVLCDPEAAQIVLNAPVQKTMIPLNVSHTAIVTKQIQYQLLLPGCSFSNEAELPEALTPLRHTLSTLIIFFAGAYRSTFGFKGGPPLHDALTIAYISHPDLFDCQRYRVDVECHGTHSFGETVVDVWQYRTCDGSWGSNGRNCLVAKSVNVNAFFDIFLRCITRCDAVSPLNKSRHNPSES